MAFPLRLYTAWIYEHSTYCEGWVAYDIEAGSHAEAVEIAHRRFVGTGGAWTLEIDRAPQTKPGLAERGSCA